MEIQNKPPTVGIVFISFIKDIRTFHVVNETFLKNENDWFKVCELEAKRYKRKFTAIEVGEIYLVENKLDRKYYRVLLQEIKSNFCKVKLIDYGNDLNVLQEKLVKCPEMLKSCKPKARECSFYNIEWNTNKEKNKALACVAGERRLFQMFTIANEDNVSFVDLITLKQRRFSVRDFLLSYNMGIVNETFKTRAVDDIEGIIKEMYANNLNENINGRSLKLKNCYDVKVRQVYSPDEFYVCETKDLDAEADLQRQMKEYYAVLTPEMFGPIATRSYYAIQLTDDSWHRIEVLEKFNDNRTCLILFIDNGMIQNEVSFNKLLLLNEQFYDFKRMAIKCLMANITPINGDGWSKETIKLLKYALEFVQENELVRIKVESFCKIDQAAEVTIKMIKESIKINVNMSLVHFNHASTELPQSPPFTHNVDVVTQDEELKPTPIDILSMDEAKPDEFYFAYKRFAGGLENIRDIIQSKMKESKRKLINWKKGDVCMVYYREQLGKPTLYWYRGIIELINVKIRKCCVFLCDRGTRVVCSISMLRECPIEFKDIPNSCHRAHLPCSPLNASQWSRESIKMFRCFLQDYNNFSITVPDSAEVNSKCVSLWGQKFSELYEEHNGYYNIIKELVSAGIAEADDLFKQNYTFSIDFAYDINEEVEKVNEPILKLPEIATGQVMVLNYEVKLKKQRIIEWLPANQSKKVFVGLPTYVDNNSIISMNDNAEEYCLKSISQILNKYYDQNTQCRAHMFMIGEPCIARFLLDGLFYRGKIVEAYPSSYEVMFIDYGNTERCNQSDIFNEVLCSEIPNMSYKFLLPSLNISINQTLNSVLHSLIVDKVCNISVLDDNDENDLIPFCRITVDSLVINSFRDVTNYLIQ